MKKFLICFVALVLSFACCTYFTYDPVYAAKKAGNKAGKKGGSKQNQIGPALKFKSRDGGNTVFGSVLNAKNNEIKTKLSRKILKLFRKNGNQIDSITLTPTKVADGTSSNIYTIDPDENVTDVGKFLLISLLPATDVSGNIYTAGALPSGQYTITLRIDDKDLKGVINYEPPAVIVGNVTDGENSCRNSTHQVTDITGESLSQTVALSGCSFFNEVRANKIEQEKKKTSKARSYLRAQIAPGTDDPGAQIAASDDVIAGLNVVVDPLAGKKKGPVAISPDLNGAASEVNSNTDFQVDLLITEDEDDLSKIDVNELIGLFQEIIEIAIQNIDLLEIDLDDLGALGEAFEELIAAKGLDDDDVPEFSDDICLPLFEDYLANVPPNPTPDDFVELGKLAFDQVQSGLYDGCIPSFVKEEIQDIIDSKGEEIGFAVLGERFVFHFNESINGFDALGLCFLVQDEQKCVQKKVCKKDDFCYPPDFAQIIKEEIEFVEREEGGLFPDEKEACNFALKFLESGMAIQCEDGPTVCGFDHLQPLDLCFVVVDEQECVKRGQCNQETLCYNGWLEDIESEIDRIFQEGGSLSSSEQEACNFAVGFLTSGEATICDDDDHFEEFVDFDDDSSVFKVNRAQKFDDDFDDCVDIGPVDQPNICAPCNTANDCISPTSGGGSSKCDFPAVTCRTDLTDHDGNSLGQLFGGDGFQGVCNFEKGKVPIDPFTCEPFPFDNDPVSLCVGAPFSECFIDQNGLPVGRFDKACCPGFESFDFARLQQQTSFTEDFEEPFTPIFDDQINDIGGCVFDFLCFENRDDNFIDTKFGAVKDEAVKKAIDFCTDKATCPLDKFDCGDGRCLESPEECGNFCPSDKFDCGDGHCVEFPEQCPLICPEDAPFLCDDGSCMKFLEDCPILGCPEDAPIQCEDGTCTATLSDCPENCPLETPVKCSDGSCVVSGDQCPQFCPEDFPVLCDDGTCAVVFEDCPKKCLDDAPFLCDDGSCAVVPEDCPKVCPEDAPIQCDDGSCAAIALECPCPDPSQVRCDDNACVASSGECITANGCPQATPVKCSDDSCVVSESDCPIPGCPEDKPIQCEDGTCTATLSDCPENCPLETPVKCSDGSCVVSGDQCPE